MEALASNDFLYNKTYFLKFKTNNKFPAFFQVIRATCRSFRQPHFPGIINENHKRKKKTGKNPVSIWMELTDTLGHKLA